MHQPGYMLEKLDNILQYGVLHKLLDDPNRWETKIINLRKPHTYRLFTTMPDGLRVCLHKFKRCDEHEAFFHPHPWPGAFLVLKGGYDMKMAYSHGGRNDENPIPMPTFYLHQYSKYEIIDPLIWHSVVPRFLTYTIMVNEEPWPASYAHTSVRTTQGKDLKVMSEKDKLHYLDMFKNMYIKWHRRG